MRGKRKQVNKYNPKEIQNNKGQNDDQYLRRTSGTKPFQLAKLRQVQRYSVDIAHMKNQIMHRRTGSNNLINQNQPQKGLIIKPKLIVENNPKLEGQRNEQTLLDIVDEKSHSNQFTQTIIDQEPLLEQRQFYSKQNRNETHEEMRIFQKHQSLQQRAEVHEFKSPIYSIITQKHQPNKMHSKENVLQQKEEERSKLEIKLMKQKALPPFSFTNTKWRSRSQTVQIDKWKQKYGKDQKASLSKNTASLSKIDQRNEIYKKIDEVKSFIHSYQSQKGSLPNLHNKPKQLQSKAKIFTKEDIFKIDANPELSKYRYVQAEYKKSREGHKKKKREEKIQIAIKKMYNHQQSLEKGETKAQQKDQKDLNQIKQEQSIHQKGPKGKKKKLKFPQIQITTFYSTKQEQNEKRRLKLQSIHKLAKQWRNYHVPKKIYRSKMQEIPEHWQYGYSRQSSRAGQQVDNYLKIKEEEAKHSQIQLELQLEKGDLVKVQ